MPVLHRVDLQALECTGCGEFEEIRRSDLSDPELLTSLIEMVHLDHAPCDAFRDVRMAKQARRFRKKLRLRTPRGAYARAETTASGVTR